MKNNDKKITFICFVSLFINLFLAAITFKLYSDHSEKLNYLNKANAFAWYTGCGEDLKAMDEWRRITKDKKADFLVSWEKK